MTVRAKTAVGHLLTPSSSSIVSTSSARRRLATTLAALLLLAACDATAPEEAQPDPPAPPTTKPDYGALRWTPTHGPYGGRITGFASLPEGGLFASTAFAGVFRASDEGKRWTASNEGLPTLPQYVGQDVALVSVAASGNDLFVATEDDGVYRSTDGGARWEPASSGIGDPRYAVTLAAGPQGTLLFSTYFGGLYRSTNHGATWHSVGKEVTGTYNTDRAEHLALSPDGTAYASNRSRVFRSDDGGSTWAYVSSVRVGSHTSTVSGLAVAPDGALLAVTHDGPIRSTDRGETWIEIPSLPESSRTFAFHGTAWAAGSSNEVYLSENSGRTWTSISAGLEAVSITAIAFDERGQVFVGTYEHGLWRYDGGKHRWLQVGVPNAAVGSIAQEGSALYAGSNRGLFRLLDDGSWERLLEGYVRAVAVDEGGQLLAGKGGYGYSGDLVRSTDGGQTWTETGIDANVLLAHDGFLYAGSEPGFDQDGGVYRSEDDGASWMQTASGLEHSVVFDLAFDEEGTLLAATGGGLYALELGGGQWVPLDPGPGSHRVWSVAVTPEGALFAGLSGRVIRSTDAGQSWETVLEVEGADFKALCVDGQGGIFAGADTFMFRSPSNLPNGVYVSSDGGNSWSRTIEGLGQREILALHATPDGHIYAGTRHLRALPRKLLADPNLALLAAGYEFVLAERRTTALK